MSGVSAEILRFRCDRFLAIYKALYAFNRSTVGAAINLTGGFNAMSDDLATPVSANGSKRLNRAFEAIKNIRCSKPAYFKCLFVILTPYFTFSHHLPLL